MVIKAELSARRVWACTAFPMFLVICALVFHSLSAGHAGSQLLLTGPVAGTLLRWGSLGCSILVGIMSPGHKRILDLAPKPKPGPDLSLSM